MTFEYFRYQNHPMKLLSLILCLLTGPLACYSQLRLPAIFTDHMVLQQQAPVPIWGWSRSTTDITIRVSWDTTTIRTKSDNTTFWSATLYTPTAGGPHTITIRMGGEERILRDVLIGEVWLCSGQSNMEWSMNSTADGKPIVNNVNDPNIRLFHVPQSAASSSQVRGEGTWKVCDADAVRYFSAVAYFYGKKLHQNLNVPIGLIHASWGGTPAETWLPEDVINANEQLKASALKQVDDRPWCPSKPGVVYNSMLRPIIPYRIAGAIWYQGESNTGEPSTYKQLMDALIGTWRKDFRYDFPFYYVQIAPYSGYSGDIGVQLREQQVDMLQIPKTEMVVVSDVVDNVKDIHPQYKKPVGERLAQVALGDAYHMKGTVYKSPRYQSMTIEKNKIRLAFINAPTGLLAKGGELTGFEIAGDDGKFYPARASIAGSAVVVSAKEVKSPKVVRFAWTNDATPNLFSKEGLPVPSFRTQR